MKLLAVAVAVLALLSPAPAGAAEVHVESGAVVYTAAPGEANLISIYGTRSGRFSFADRSGGVQATAPCTREESTISCPTDGATPARFDLGDGDDAISHADADLLNPPGVLPIVVSAGEGSDNVLGSDLADVIDGGGGNDNLPGAAGDDKVTGGPGDDDVNGNDGSDAVDGGAGDDRVQGGPGHDDLRAGTGVDDVRGGEGDDKIDTRNGEVDLGKSVSCDEGSDTLSLDEQDKILEWKQPSGVWWVEPTCEKITGQRNAPKPTEIRLRNGSASGGSVNVVNALPATITFEILVGRRVVRRAVVKDADGPRVVVRLKKVGKVSRGTWVTMRVKVVDSAGRRSQGTFKDMIRR